MFTGILVGFVVKARQVAGFDAAVYCDCDQNVLDVLGNCGGGCEADIDEDGICDDVDPCPEVEQSLTNVVFAMALGQFMSVVVLNFLKMHVLAQQVGRLRIRLSVKIVMASVYSIQRWWKSMEC